MGAAGRGLAIPKAEATRRSPNGRCAQAAGLNEGMPPKTVLQFFSRNVWCRAFALRLILQKDAVGDMRACRQTSGSDSRFARAAGRCTIRSTTDGGGWGWPPRRYEKSSAPPFPSTGLAKKSPGPWPRKTWQGKPPPIRCRLWSFGCSRLHLALRLPEGSRRTRRHRLGRPPRSGHHLARRAVSQPGMREFAHRAFPGKSRLRPSSRAIAHAASTERRGMGRCPQRCRQHG